MNSSIRVYQNELQVRVRWNVFDTHIMTTKKKFVKVNGQQIYRSMNQFSRAALMKNLKNALLPMGTGLRKAMLDNKVMFSGPNYRLETIVGVPLSYGSVAMRTVDGFPVLVHSDKQNKRWDIGNHWVWGKAFLDMCQEIGVLRDDCVPGISGECTLWGPVDHIDQRYLEFRFVPDDPYGR